MLTNIWLIGSTIFEEIFRELEVSLSIKGYIVLSPLVYNQTGENPLCGEENKIILDYVQKEKIRQSDLVLVIDKDKYIGSSTKNQIEYAKFLNKRVLYYSKGDVKKLWVD